MRMNPAVLLAALACAIFVRTLSGQTTTSAATAPDDNPKINVGATIFGDFTYASSPRSLDADGNEVRNSSFNITRAYINITGSLNHRIAFRITPDVARESGSGASLAGSQEFRLKYAYAQFNLDDWTTKGSWVRFGVHQTPLLDFEEGIYRYRFQGSLYGEREGYFPSADGGLSGRWMLPGNRGDVQGGFFNGEGYSKSETNNEKALQLRASFRPLPESESWRGLRITGFADEDHYLKDAKRTRLVGEVTFESPRINAGIEAIDAKDQTSAAKAVVEGRGWSAWVTPRWSNGLELLLRHDVTTPDRTLSSRRHIRNIGGVAYWFQHLQKVSAAILVDVDSLRQPGFDRPDETKFGIKMLIAF